MDSSDLSYEVIMGPPCLYRILVCSVRQLGYEEEVADGISERHGEGSNEAGGLKSIAAAGELSLKRSTEAHVDYLDVRKNTICN